MAGLRGNDLDRTPPPCGGASPKLWIRPAVINSCGQNDYWRESSPPIRRISLWITPPKGRGGESWRSFGRSANENSTSKPRRDSSRSCWSERPSRAPPLQRQQGDRQEGQPGVGCRDDYWRFGAGRRNWPGPPGTEPGPVGRHGRAPCRGGLVVPCMLDRRSMNTPSMQAGLSGNEAWPSRTFRKPRFGTCLPGLKWRARPVRSGMRDQRKGF